MRKRYDTSTDPARGQIRREIAAALGFLLIFLDILAATLMPASATQSPLTEELFGNRIVICTGAGMIVIDADGNLVQQTDGVQTMCPFCLPLVGGSIDGPTSAPLLAPPTIPAAPAITVAAELLPVWRRPLATASPRGPPLS